MTCLISASEASLRLGVTRQTLYSYVSRGLLKAFPGEDHRESLYSAAAVDHLATDRKRGRKPKEIAKATLDWGLPVLESRLTLIQGGRLYYRGYDAVNLAQASSVEDLAALLWDVPRDDAFGSLVAGSSASLKPPTERPFRTESLLVDFAATTYDDDTAEWQEDRSRLAAGCGALVRNLLACLLNTPPSATPIHLQCAQAWKLDDEGADLVRMALILSADHELNASSFTARCVASTGASVRASIIGGLAALSGSRHGGMTTLAEALWHNIMAQGDPLAASRRILAAGGLTPGFGHPLYPDGDIRAKVILERVARRLPEAIGIMDAVTSLTGRHPSLDFALVALRRSLNLPEGMAFGLFALGRSIGWTAQALEQRFDGTLIRPRAIYVGPAPGS